MVWPPFPRSCQGWAWPQLPIIVCLRWYLQGPTHGALLPQAPCSCSSHEPYLQKSSFSLGTGEKQKSPALVCLSTGHAPSHLPRVGNLSKGLRSTAGGSLQRPGRMATHLEGRKSWWWREERRLGVGVGAGHEKQPTIWCLAVVMRGSIHRQRCARTGAHALGWSSEGWTFQRVSRVEKGVWVL